jgi:hypothetical protein
VDDTPNLGLPYIMAAQSQKHVTHNEAIRALDAMVQLAVLDRDLAAPPGSPAEGARYIVGSSPTGAWSGHADEVAAYQDGAWMLYAPVEGWIAWIADEDSAVVWDGTTWSALTTGGGGGSASFTTLAINGATADTTNRLSLNAPATLLNHDGAGHQLKINKAAASDTASLLYQDAFSGRAELGLAGDDDFHFKVSPDGSTWKEAIVISRSSGVVTFPFTSLSGGRELLAANRTYYVRTDGSDSNTGLANTSGGAFLTLQKAWNAILTLDLNGFTVTVQIGDGTYTAGVSMTIAPVGGTVIFNGNSGTPANVEISGAFVPFFLNAPCTVTVQNLKISSSSAYGIWVTTGHLFVGTGVVMGACAAVSWRCEFAGSIIEVLNTNFSIVGGAAQFIRALTGGIVSVVTSTITVTGTPAFTTFAQAEGGIISFYSPTTTFSGSATGARYSATLNAVINTFGGGANYFPGNAGGATGTGGQYA